MWWQEWRELLLEWLHYPENGSDKRGKACKSKDDDSNKHAVVQFYKYYKKIIKWKRKTVETAAHLTIKLFDSLLLYNIVT